MAQWIWYPGEFEQHLLNKVEMRRKFREHIRMPIWALAPIYPYVKFIKKITLKKPESFIVKADGEIDVEIGRNKWVPFYNGKYHLEPGEYTLWVSVYVPDGKTATCYVSGEQIKSGDGWQCTLQDFKIVEADFGGFTDIDKSPNDYRLPVEKIDYQSKEQRGGFTLYDFGKEIFGYVSLENTNKKGKVKLYFGESLSEASDFENCVLTASINTDVGETKTTLGRGFRYVSVVKEGGADYKKLSADYEYNPQSRTAVVNFKDALLQKIWDISMHTLNLNMREFYFDGIKRDRWVWSGDSTESYLMNWYSYFDERIARRTTAALAGKGEIKRHINNIPAFTLFWLISFADHFVHTGDLGFINMWSERAFALAEFVISRCDDKFRYQKHKSDWAFIDWGEGCTTPADSFSFLQILLCKAIESMAKVASVIKDEEKCARYENIAASVRADLDNYYDEDNKAYCFGMKDGEKIGPIIRQPNIMAIFYDIATGEKAEKILSEVIQNDKIPALQTPFMRLYENAALCKLGKGKQVLASIKEYWGGMIDLGATTFWELYVPEEKGDEHYAMYNDKYGRSLCHAWGASPLYLIGRWFFGLQPNEDGYKTYRLTPNLEELCEFTADLPLKNGRINLSYEEGALTVYSRETEGYVKIGDKEVFVPKNTRRKFTIG